MCGPPVGAMHIGYIAGMLTPEHRRMLRDWLLDSFGSARRLETELLLLLPDGQRALQFLPPTDTTGAAPWILDLIQYLELQGQIAPPLFDQLRALRSVRVSEIDQLQQLLLGSASPTPLPSASGASPSGALIGPLGPRLAAGFRPLPPPPPPKNPFRYGPPADGAYFVGRNEKLSLIAEKVVQGTPVALVGDPRIGKTTSPGQPRWGVPPFWVPSAT